MSSDNPFAAPSMENDWARENVRGKEYGGIRRLPYFGISFGVGIVNSILQAVADAAGAPAVVLIFVLLGLVVSIVLIVQRLKNLGYSGWWTLGIIVPFLNILIALRCLAAPEGYADHKTLDTPGKVICGIFLGLIVLLLLIVVMVVIGGAR